MSQNTASPTPRLVSLDALRGFDMLWILGGDSLARACSEISNRGPFGIFGEQLEHVEWAGFHFYDMIFPLFVFIVGVSIVFSLSKSIEAGGRGQAMQRIVKRTLLLYVIALLYSGGFTNHWPDIRLLGVLNRIALCYGAASLLFCFLPWRALAGACAGLLIGYWALMSFVPFPDVRPVDANGVVISQTLTATNVSELNFSSSQTLRGVFEPGLNLANYVDQKYLPGKKWDKTWDPEGLLSTLPAIGTCLLGVLAGLLLKNVKIGELTKVKLLIGLGVLSVMAGFAWGHQFPVIKKIWTSSFVLVAGGYSAILLGIFYLLVDVWQMRAWCQPFIWIGMNPITAYLADNLMGFGRVSKRFLGGDVQDFFNLHLMTGSGDLLLAFGEIGIAVLLVWFLQRRKIFLRV